ncbi:MAG: hypothetical protein IJK47_06000 [Lachnospiraceae bacterium]|nr:hypothetical protein [Lachnospiraceae bacterium]
MKDIMRSLLTVRKQVQSLFAEWNVYLVMAAKTALTFAVILSINAVFPYRAVLTRGLIVAAVAILCSVLPWGFITVFGLIFLLGQLTALSLEAALFVLVLAIALAVLNYLTLPGASVLWVLLPLLYYWKIPFVVPLLAGLFGGITTFVSVGSGTVISFVLKLIRDNAPLLSGASSVTESGQTVNTLVQRLLFLVEGFLKNNEMILTLIVFCLTTLLVNLLSRTDVDYAHVIALGAGGLFCPVLLAVSLRYAGISVSAGSLILNTLFALVAAFAVDFLATGLDYARTEKVQFEDDDYYYFVKAVPKMKLPEEKMREKAQALQQELKKTAEETKKGR